MNENLKKHRRITEKYLKMYDSKESLLWFHTKKDLYHSKLADSYVHTIRDSLELAVALMYCRENDKEKTAIKIIERVLKLQDSDEASETYGLWPYYLEEPLESMNPPDKNEADFNGKNFAHLLLVFSDKFSDELIERIKSSCIMACDSIIRRNEGVNYTNVAITDCYVTIATGELTNRRELFEYGIEKLKKFNAFCLANGGVFEYNSPDYNPLAALDVARVLRDVKSAEAIAEAEKANNMIWKMIAEHFLPNINQLAGPHSRSYHEFIQPKILKYIELASDGAVEFGAQSEDTMSTYWDKPICPPEYYGYFNGEMKKSDIRIMNMRGFNYPFFAFAQTAVTHNEEMWSVGSFNREELWNQRRPMQVYIKNGDSVTGFRVRFLHDGYDFSSAQLHCVQENSAVLGVINMACNRGDTHISLDTIENDEIKASELTASFEFSGRTDNIRYNKSDKGYFFYIDKTVLYIDLFACDEMEKEVMRTDNGLSLKVYFYKGARRNIQLSEPEKLCCGFVMELSSHVKEYEKAQYSFTDIHINCSWEVNGSELEVRARKKSGRFIDMMTDDSQYINKIPVEKLCENA